jgi:dipeptidyl aminopeptidase/acylaminoacyl peptidase
MRRTLATLLLAAALAAQASTAAQAAERAPDPADAFSAEKMWTLARLGETAISPDGRLAAVTVTRYDMAADRGLTDIWLVPVAGGPARQLTSDKAADTSPAFSPDGRSLAFLSKRGDDKEPQV